jgi:hypothetical protein
MDPLTAWVDLEPPLAAAGSRPAMTDERGLLDLLGYGSAEEPLDGGETAHGGAVAG